jgi:hypothetical protein
MRKILVVVFAFLVVIGMRYTAKAQSVGQNSSTDALIEVDVIGDVTVSAVQGVLLNNLAAGTTYTLSPDAGSVSSGTTESGGFAVTPMINGNEAGTAADFNIVSSSASSVENVSITFILPTVLVANGVSGGSGSATSNGSGATLPISFGPRSGLVVNTAGPTNGVYFNPNVPNTIAVPAGGIDIFLGCTITIPSNAAADQYFGVVICTASLTGL